MGFNVKKLNDVINDMLINIVAYIDEVTDVNVGSVLRQLTEALAQEVEVLYVDLDVVYDGTRISTATDIDLENLGSLVGITRKSGTKSQGYVTFKRKTPAGADFTIPAGTIISVQPNTGEEQLRFVVKAHTTFYSTITDETHKFINGIWEYALNERFINNVISLDGTSSGSPHTFILNTDYEIDEIDAFVVDADNINVLDNCDATTDWNKSADATVITTDLVDYKQGGGSLKLGKNGVASTEANYDKVLGSLVDGSSKDLYLYIKIADNPTRNKINYIKVSVGSGGSLSNSYSYKIYKRDLETGWQMARVQYSASTIEKIGIPSEVAFNYLRISIVTNNASDTITSGDIKMDYWIASTSTDYEGDIIRFLQTGTIPDSNTNFYTDYRPLSREVLCESEYVGTKYNVSRLKIIYKVSYIANIDSVNNYIFLTGGTDIESDDDMRERILNATELVGKATVEALRQAVLGVEGVTSVSVDDMPFRTTSAEAHHHISFAGTPTMKVDYEVALNDTDFEINGTRGGSPITFVKNTDYYVSDSTITWVSDLLDPDDATDFYVDYNYRWLGHVRMFVAGASTPLPAEIITNIDTAIEDTRAAGIDVQWAEPTVVAVDVSAGILVDTANGYTFAGLEPLVVETLTEFLNSKETGDDVYIAELIETIMGVSGVLNTTVTVPASDLVIDVDEVARSGSVIISSL